MGLPEIVIYSKPDCCLCERTKEQLARLQRRHEFALREVNILEDPAAYEKYRDDIPVIFADGRKAFKHRLDENHLSRCLNPLATSDERKADQHF
jgi:glutaredoxin